MITKEMLNFFYKRTRKHINLVNKYMDLIIAKFPDTFKTLKLRELLHDNSKFYEPEFTPYIYLTWNYYCKDHKIPFTISKKMQQEIQEATYHHCKNNRHHPEFFDINTTIDSINKNDRDATPTSMVDGTEMGDVDIAEMCADWMAMSEERHNSPQSWAKKNINIRWKFTEKQEKLIYTILNKVWGKDDN